MKITPPIAPKKPKVTSVHDDTLVDDYFWMRDKDSPELLSHLKAENAYTDAVMAPTAELQEKLYNEILGRIKETDLSVPYPKDGYFYYTRTEEGQQYPIYCRKQGNLDADEVVLLDLNQMAAGKAFFSLGGMTVSDDGNLLAYITDETGFRQYNLHVVDLRMMTLLPDTAERVTSICWASDNRTLLLTTEDATTKRSNRFLRQVLGTPGELVYEEPDELYHIHVSRTRSREYLILSIESSTTTECRYLRSDDSGGELRLMFPRQEDHEYYPDHHGERFYIRTNDKGRNFRLVTTSIEAPSRQAMEEVIAHRDTVMLEDCDFFAGYCVVHEREDGLIRFRVLDLMSGESHYIAFPEAVYTVFGSANAEYVTELFRFGYLSLVTPNSVFEYDLRSRRTELLKQTEVLGGYDSAQYQSERLFATAGDGTRVPISVVYRKGMVRNGTNPLLLDGYGSYGIANDVDFSSNRVSLLDRGFIFAIAHIRGGGDLGKPWHDQGKLMVKKNTFTDFIACAEYLVRERYTSPDKLIITGGSAGGLLMGAVANLRPDLFKAVVSYVPFVDVINTMLDATLPLTVGEYLEWGNPNERDAYSYMKSYSPYDNIEAKHYPAMLIRTSLNDSQVMYWEPAKYVARLRDRKIDDNHILFKVKLEPGGHGGASGRYDRLRDLAFDYSYILTQVGIHA